MGLMCNLCLIIRQNIHIFDDPSYLVSIRVSSWKWALWYIECFFLKNIYFPSWFKYVSHMLYILVTTLKPLEKNYIYIE